MYKKAWCTCKLVVLLNKPIAVLTFSLPSPSPSSLLKLLIRRFHVVVVQWTSKKCTKKRDVCAELLFWSLNLLFSWSRRRGRRRGCLSSLFSSNDRALLARCPRHIQSVFNFIVDIPMDIHIMVNWQLSKRASAVQCHMTVSWAQVYNSLRWRVF